MPELRDDTTEDGFHEIQFTRKQLVFLFMTASVLLSLVFILGVLTGRGMANRGGETPIGAEIAELPPSQEPGDQSSVSTEQRNPAATTDLSYPESLSANPAGEKPKPAEQPPVSTTAEPPAITPPVTAVPPATVESPAAKPRAEEEKPAPRADAARVKVPTSGRPGAWVIQVMALRTRQPAVERVQSLISKGYDAFLEDSAPGVYRVRIGRFKQRADAERVARRLQKEERLSPVISR